MKSKTITVKVLHVINHEFVNVPETAVLHNIENHDVYILESALNGTQLDLYGNPDYETCVYREDGTKVMCAYVFGRTGKSLRWAALRYHAQKNFIIKTTNGMSGATGHGWGASLRLIDWDGSKYAAARAEAERTGKKLLHA